MTKEETQIGPKFTNVTGNFPIAAGATAQTSSQDTTIVAVQLSVVFTGAPVLAGQDAFLEITDGTTAFCVLTRYSNSVTLKIADQGGLVAGNLFCKSNIQASVVYQNIVQKPDNL